MESNIPSTPSTPMNISEERIKVLTLPESASTLNTPCKPVTEVTPLILELSDKLKLYLLSAQDEKARPVAVSAPQLGYSLRMFAFLENPLQVTANPAVVTVINPTIKYTKGSQRSTESCASIPGKKYNLKRPKIVKIYATILPARLTHTCVIKQTGFGARMIMHEMDHLDGITLNLKGKEV